MWISQVGCVLQIGVSIFHESFDDNNKGNNCDSCKSSKVMLPFARDINDELSGCRSRSWYKEYL